ncbi:hypothetical protein CLOM_g15631 [Closterium sp. NIES-68]|nr:hypothetical protein CLOM_g15631 [Closterium sp. NIES-68]GJP83279.1 hypothetical protein CLOP_g13452 [Closterium sp. NIES-67]
MGRIPAFLGLVALALASLSLSSFPTICVAQDSRSWIGIDGSEKLADSSSVASRRISSGQRWLLAAAGDDEEEEAAGGDDEDSGAGDKESDAKTKSAASEEEEEGEEEEAPLKKKAGVKKPLIKTKTKLKSKLDVAEEEVEVDEPAKPVTKSSLKRTKKKAEDAEEEEEAEAGGDDSQEADVDAEDEDAAELKPKAKKAATSTSASTSTSKATEGKKKRADAEEGEEKEGADEGGEEKEDTTSVTKKKRSAKKVTVAAADEEEEEDDGAGGKKAGGNESDAADADADADTDADADAGAAKGKSKKAVKTKGKAQADEEEEEVESKANKAGGDEGADEEAAEGAGAGGKASTVADKESEEDSGAGGEGEEESVPKKKSRAGKKMVEEEEEQEAAAAEGEGEGDGVEEKGERGGEEEGSGAKSGGSEAEGEGESEQGAGEEESTADKAADDSGGAAAAAGAGAGAAGAGAAGGAVPDQDEQKEQQEQQQEEQQEQQEEQKSGKEEPPKTPTAEEQEDKQEPAPEQEAEADAESFAPCDAALTDYTPCEDVRRSLAFPRKMYEYRERHCPPPSNALSCLVPPPVGYRSPPQWPESRDWAWYANVPYKHLTEEKAGQNWVRYDQQQQKFVFPGGGTMFPKGADAYVKGLGKIIPDFGNGSVRTVVDTGCGVASFGAALLSHNMVAMSFAPRDTHEAQVQFALERGVPAMLGIMATKRQPYPARAFDLAHCSRCLIPWSIEGGLYLIEVDRLLRPGGYWVLSGPPVDWQHHNKHWGKPEAEMRAQDEGISAVAAALCWKKVGQKDAVAVWQKRADDSCFAGKKGEERRRRLGELVGAGGARRVLAGGGGGGADGSVAEVQLELCPESDNPDDAWYTPMRHCVSRAPRASRPTPRLAPWPKRLAQATPRIRRADASAAAAAASDGTGNSKTLVKRFLNSLRRWTKRVAWYKEAVLPALGQGRYRNVMDMNAGVGSFAAALAGDPVWVMNVVPVETPAEVGEQQKKAGKGEDGVGAAGLPGYQWRVSAKTESLGLPPGEALGVIYERGLIGTYQDWCEPFSTYPRTYDLIHAAWLFSAISKRCSVEVVLMEMDRILRPEGAVIFRDSHAVLRTIQPLAKRLRWDARFEANRPGGSGRILVCVKKYWVEG